MRIQGIWFFCISHLDFTVSLSLSFCHTLYTLYICTCMYLVWMWIIYVIFADTRHLVLCVWSRLGLWLLLKAILHPYSLVWDEFVGFSKNKDFYNYLLKILIPIMLSILIVPLEGFDSAISPDLVFVFWCSDALNLQDIIDGSGGSI